ncbi:hypothetical protein [Microcoleus sp. S36b_A2]|uniref:hypothetical protein n=1 Tax=Microcoleus sp. S36b_A2 TaxID=3055418 RepID=UPI002FD040FD
MRSIYSIALHEKIARNLVFSTSFATATRLAKNPVSLIYSPGARNLFFSTSFATATRLAKKQVSGYLGASKTVKIICVDLR